MKTLIMMLAILLSLSSYSALAQDSGDGGGNEGGHGGDFYAQEFVSIAKAIQRRLVISENTDSSFKKWHLTADAYANAIANTRVVSKPAQDMILRGEEVAGINNVNIIKVNRDRWAESNNLSRVKLVFHEYLGIMAIEQDNYNASDEFSSLLREVAAALSKKSGASTSIIYGHVNVYASLDTIDTCSGAGVSDGIRAAKMQALGRCKLAGKKDCKLVVQELKEIISTTTLGLRYCEVSTIYK